MNYAPGGYSDFEDDEYEEYDGYYFEKSVKTRNTFMVEKTEQEQFSYGLLDSINHGDLDGLRELLDKGISTGFDIDTPIEGHWSLLFHACSLASFEIVKFLIVERGCTLDVRIDGNTPLMVACMAKEKPGQVLKVVKMLIQKEPKLINRTNLLGENSLMLAAQSGHFPVVQYLLNIESFDSVNNCGRNVLFYAIERKDVEMAKLLFATTIDLDVVDSFGTTAKKFAIECDAREIYELFPPEEYKYQTPANYLSYSDFDSLIPDTLDRDAVPSYFPDIATMLRSMDCDRFIPLFSQANISLEKFLTINDDELETIGIPLPYQRKIILLGIHNFFKGKWSCKSIYVPGNIKTHLSPIDLIYIFSNVLRQTIILKSQLIYLKRLEEDYGIQSPVNRISLEHFKNFHESVDELTRKMKTMKVTKRPLLIEKQTQSIESNVIRRSKTFDAAKRALKIILPFALISTITLKLFLNNK